MERIRAALGEIRAINDSFHLPNTAVDRLLNEMNASKVTAPIIGKFSSGKSSVLNALLGYAKVLLKVSITPETAVPAEIVYGPEDFVRIVYRDERTEDVDIPAFRRLEVRANEVRAIRLQLRNEQFLAKIPDVMLVDMPGFDSGMEMHNRAIDGYLPQSMAYLVAFPADDMTLKTSIAQTLKELSLHEMPICVVVTKRDRVDEDVLRANMDRLKQDLGRLLGRGDIHYCTTSRNEGDAEELKHYLLEIQERSQQLLAGKYRQHALSEADKLFRYLTAAKNGRQLSRSELEEKEDALKKQMDALHRDLDEERERFLAQIPTFAHEVKADVRSSLQANESVLVTMILNQDQDGVQERINAIVRESLTRSVQQRLLPQLERYASRLSERIRVDSMEDIGMLNLNFQLDTKRILKGVLGSVVAMYSLMLLGPIWTALAAIFLWRRSQNRKREELKEHVRQQLNESAFPSIVEQVGSSVEHELRKQVMELNESIAADIADRRLVLEKAMQDIREQRNREQREREQALASIDRSLERIEAIKHEL